MTDAAAAFHRVLSDRHFFGRSLATATISAVVSATLLVGIALCTGGITQLIVQGPSADGLTQSIPASSSLLASSIANLIGILPALRHSSSALVFFIGMLCSLIVIRTLLRTHVERRIDTQVASSVNRLREHIHRHALRRNPSDLSGRRQLRAAELFHQTAQELEDNARRWGLLRLTSACNLIVLVIILLCVQWRVGVECIVPILICWYISRIEADRHDTSAHLLIEQAERGLQDLTENLTKARIVAGYGMESLEHDELSDSLRTHQKRSKHLHEQQQQGRWSSLIVNLFAIAVPGTLLARHLLFGTLISIPSAVVLALVIGLITVALRRLQEVPTLYGAATVAADEITQYLLRVPNVSQVVGAHFLEPMARTLQFDQVTVETEDRPELLSSLDLKIEFGQRIAVLSLNPLEAEALVSLIPRFDDPSGGQVLIDGADIREVTLESLRAEAVIVGGDETPFNTTVIENITAGQSNISRQDAIEAGKIVHAENFIRQLPKGYETDLGQFHLTEPGQRFRLNLARAVARKPAILVIQEPDAVLDSETKTMLDDTYQRICTDRTVLFIPTRLSTVKKCDRIIMIHDGRVAVDGRHEDLVRTSELYRHWEYMRFNVFRED